MKHLIPQNNKGFKTPQGLIHISHTMTIIQYKYWILLLHNLKRQVLQGINPDEKGFYYISMKEVNALMGLKATQKKSIIFDDLKALKNITVSYNILEKDGQKAKVGHGFISEWSVSNNRIGYILPSTFVSMMLELDENKQNIFQILNWEIFNSFSGKYEAIIYKLCKDYVGIGKTPKFSIDKFREYLGLKNNEYEEFKILNHWTIKNPIKSINKSEISDIDINVEFERKGRKIVSLQFIVKQKQKALPFDEKNPHIAFASTKISIKTEKQQEYLEKYSNEQIEAILERANEYIEKLSNSGKKINIGAIYNKAFNEGWGLDALEAKQQEKAKEEERRRKAEEIKEAELKAKKEEEEKLLKEKEEIEICLKKFEELPKEEQELILDTIENQSPSFMKKWFRKDRDIGNNPCKKPPFNYGLRDIIKERYF